MHAVGDEMEVAQRRNAVIVVQEPILRSNVGRVCLTINCDSLRLQKCTQELESQLILYSPSTASRLH